MSKKIDIPRNSSYETDLGNINIPQYVAAISSGTIDGALLMASDGVAAIDNGAGFIEVATGRDSVEGNPHMTYVTLKDNAGISRGKDLVGKKVGVSSKLGCTAGFPLEYAAQDGVENPLNSISFVVAQEVTLVDALRKGSVDVVGLHLPETVINKLYPDVKVLFTDNTILQNRGGDIGWFFPKKFVDANPEAVKGFVTAIAKANDWINANPEEAKELYWKINPNVNKDTFVINHFAEHGLIQESHVQIWLDILGSGKSIQTLKNKWTFDQIATNKYNPNAK